MLPVVAKTPKPLSGPQYRMQQPRSSTLLAYDSVPRSDVRYTDQTTPAKRSTKTDERGGRERERERPEAIGGSSEA